ncbi:MAG: DUF4287 domain-containing protein [Acidobacteria bacterium]|nr:DUF4287 domain-containing protein [Acidobacteriota bacterium]MCB9397814.1 DUF4287 domain-containing protein [Acidobacteriota bacterium]
MAKTSAEIERDFIQSLPAETGQNLEQWLKALKANPLDKRNEQIEWLKTERGWGHMNASLLVGIYHNHGRPVYGQASDLLENQFAKAEHLRPAFERLKAIVLERFPQAQLIPKKTYISFTQKREFLAVNVKSKELRLGLDLGDVAFSDNLQKAKLSGPMPRFTHMIVLGPEDTLHDRDWIWINQSHQRVHPG